MIIGIIPARYGSSRFPGKPLIEIEGKSMIQRVYEQAIKAKCLSKVIVATDDERIFDHVKAFGGEVVMTKKDHPSGTDRCWEVVQSIVDGQESTVDSPQSTVSSQQSIVDSQQSAENSSEKSLSTIHYPLSTTTYILNIQGDEPFIVPEQIDELGAILDGEIELATQMIPVNSPEVLFDMGEVKIVLNDKQEALYFSRQAIPFLKNIDPKDWHKNHQYYRHVGMYAYRADVLEKLTQLPPSSLEIAESLEQLRWLEAGFKIKCVITNYDSHCIDTPEDIEKVLRLIRKK